MFFLAWILGGLVSIAGALCYAELTTAFPNTGGDYHFIGRAYGKKPAFLFAWARMSVIQTGSIALLAYILATIPPRYITLANNSYLQLKLEASDGTAFVERQNLFTGH